MHAREGKSSCWHTDPSSDFHRLSTLTKYLDAIVHKHRSFLWIRVLARSPLCTWTATMEHSCHFPPTLVSYFSVSSLFREDLGSDSLSEEVYYSPPTFLQCNVDLCNRSISSFLPPACFSHDVMTHSGFWFLALVNYYRGFHSSTPRILRLPPSFPSVRFLCPAAGLHSLLSGLRHSTRSASKNSHHCPCHFLNSRASIHSRRQQSKRREMNQEDMQGVVERAPLPLYTRSFFLRI